jgi:hypothetical protein
MLRPLPCLLLLALPSCARPDAHDSSAPVESASASAASASAASISAASASASAAPPLSGAPVASVVVPVIDAGPPRQVVHGDGITITETGGGEVVLKTTSLWNESIDTTYASCDYYKGALPVLKRQLREDRAKLLATVCTGKK